MEIRIKPEVVQSRLTYDLLDKVTPGRVRARMIDCKYDRSSRGEGVYVYWMEKHRRRVRYIQEVTCTGKPTTKKAPKRVVTPTYWCYRIHFIPKAVVDRLKASGKQIVQHDRHWSIEKVKP